MKIKILFVFLLIVNLSDLKAEIFPDFTLPKLDESSQVSLSSYQGKVILVDFWASWCGPCRTSFPIYDNLYKKYSGQGFQVIAISTDSDLQAATEFVKSLSPSFTVLSGGKSLAQNMDLPSMPTSYLLDRNGNIAFMHSGFTPGDKAILEEKIQKALN